MSKELKSLYFKSPKELFLMNIEENPERLGKFRDSQLLLNGNECLVSFTTPMSSTRINGDIKWLKSNNYKLNKDNYVCLGKSATFEGDSILLYPIESDKDINSSISTYINNTAGKRMVPIKLMGMSHEEYVFKQAEKEDSTIACGVPTTDLGFLEALFAREDFSTLLKMGTAEQIREIFSVYCVDVYPIPMHQLQMATSTEEAKQIISSAISINEDAHKKIINATTTKR